MIFTIFFIWIPWKEIDPFLVYSKYLSKKKIEIFENYYTFSTSYGTSLLSSISIKHKFISFKGRYLESLLKEIISEMKFSSIDEVDTILSINLVSREYENNLIFLRGNPFLFTEKIFFHLNYFYYIYNKTLEKKNYRVKGELYFDRLHTGIGGFILKEKIFPFVLISFKISNLHITPYLSYIYRKLNPGFKIVFIKKPVILKAQYKKAKPFSCIETEDKIFYLIPAIFKKELLSSYTFSRYLRLDLSFVKGFFIFKVNHENFKSKREFYIIDIKQETLIKKTENIFHKTELEILFYNLVSFSFYHFYPKFNFLKIEINRRIKKLFLKVGGFYSYFPYYVVLDWKLGYNIKRYFLIELTGEYPVKELYPFKKEVRIGFKFRF